MSDKSEKDIEDIKIGDKIISYDELNKEFEEDEVVNHQLTDESSFVLEIEFENGKKIKCTPDHKFLTDNRGWVDAMYLTSYDNIIEYVE